MHCPRNSAVEDDAKRSCNNCITELGDRIFRKKVMGGSIDTPISWCDEVKEIAHFVDRVVARNQECYEAITQMLSCPVEVHGEDYLVTVKPTLWEKGLGIANGPFK